MNRFVSNFTNRLDSKGRVSILPTAKWLPGDMAAAPISDAKPR